LGSVAILQLIGLIENALLVLFVTIIDVLWIEYWLKLKQNDHLMFANLQFVAHI